MDKLKRFGLVLAFSIIGVLAFAQDVNDTAQPTADIMRSNGKIYVVVAVIVTILVGVFVYLFSLDKRIKKLERGEKD
ncbi:MAG: CcmD family protein [Ilyomonas sp.]